MKSSVFIAALVLLTAGPCFAQEGAPHPMMQQMMQRNMDALGQKPLCPNCPMKAQHGQGSMTQCPNCPHCPKKHKTPSAMQHSQEREFFLDRQKELGLTAEQVKRLRDIRSACRADNIRTGAELKITRLQLGELLESDAAPEVTEPLVRKIHTLQGDMEVRHLKARQDALRVLTTDQQERIKGEAALQSLVR